MIRSLIRSGALVVALPVIASAQLLNASTAATGLGGAYTARAQGYNAVYWNPANLAMPGNPGFSFTLGAIDGVAGIRPVGLNDFAPYSGKFIPAATRDEWLTRIAADGKQNGGAQGGITELGFNIGSLGFQVNTGVVTGMDLTSDAAEAILFGNAGRDSTHTPKSLNVDNSNLNAAAYTTGAVSYGMRLPMVPLSDFAIGVTAKYTYGHGVIAANGDTSSTYPNIGVRFPYVYPDTALAAHGKAIGSGVGIDLGASWKIPGFRFGVSAQNLVNTFKWDTTALRYNDALFKFQSDTTIVDPQAKGTDLPYGGAPQVIRDKIATLKFKPAFAAGVSFDWLPKITVSADVRQQVGSGMAVGPESMAAAGAEFRWIPFIPLRGGVQMMTGGFGVSGGFGLHFAGFEAGVAGWVRKRDGAQESGLTLNAISIRP
jgi:hypothetical protein